MTDVRMPDRWLMDRRFAALSDAEWRAYTYALMFSVTNRSDGRIEPADLSLIPRFEKSAVKALVAGGLWKPLGAGKGWVIEEFQRTQTTRAEHEQLEDARRREREKKRRQRARRKEEQESGSPGTVPGDSTGEDRTGQEGQAGEDQPGYWNTTRIPADPSTGEVHEQQARDPEEPF